MSQEYAREPIVMRRTRKLSVWCCIFAGLAGCAALASSDLVLYEDARFRVSVAQDPTVDPAKSSTWHDHPMQITSDQVVRILSGVGVERSRGLLVSMVLGPQHEAAFSAEELAVLAPKISAGLLRASSKDRVSVALSRTSPSKVPENFEWALWGQGGNLFVVLTRHQIIMDRQRSELSSTLQGGATRGPGVAQDLPGDLAVGFSYPEYVVPLEPTLATQLFGNPHAYVAIDYRRFLSDGRPSATPVDKVSRGQDSSGTGASARTALSGDSASTGLPSAEIHALSERMKTLETQVNDLLGVVKQLTKELAESNKALAAREDELRALRSVPHRSIKPRSSQAPSTSP
jgi:hypothetical protein